MVFNDSKEGECEPSLKSKLNQLIISKISFVLSQTHEFEWPDSWLLPMEGLPYWSSVRTVSDHAVLHADSSGQLARVLHAGACRFCCPYVCVKDKLVCFSLSRQSARLYAQLDVAFQLLACCQHSPFCRIQFSTLGHSTLGIAVGVVLHVLLESGLAQQVTPNMPTSLSFDVTSWALKCWGEWKWRVKDDFPVTMVSDQDKGRWWEKA